MSYITQVFKCLWMGFFTLFPIFISAESFSTTLTYTRDQSMPSSAYSIQVTARALLVSDNRLLLVGHDPTYWYTPGGKLNSEETLPECLKREVYEETGLSIEVGSLIHVYEFFDSKESIHKIECFFQAHAQSPALARDWKDTGGNVSYRRFFSLEEIIEHGKVFPDFLKQGTWRIPAAINPVYIETEVKK